MRESYKLRVRQGREEEELGRQQEQRREQVESSAVVPCAARHVQGLEERRGRLRRALAGLGEEEGGREGGGGVLKETECPVCLQVAIVSINWPVNLNYCLARR